MPKKASKKEGGKEKEQAAAEEEFRIEQLFGSKTRVRLLNLFLEHPDRPFYVREVTRKIDAQLNSVRRELANLIGLGIVEEVSGTILKEELKKAGVAKIDKKKFYRANQQCSFLGELRGILKKSAVLMNKTLLKQLQVKGEIALLLLTGRFVDDESSPSDVLIVGEIDQEALEEVISGFEKELAREINYTYMPVEEFTYRKEVKDRFLMSLLGSDHILLHDAAKTE